MSAETHCSNGYFDTEGYLMFLICAQWMRRAMLRQANAFSSIAVIGVALAHSGAARAQDAKTHGGALQPARFESIDENGVDLISGKLRIRTPVIETGAPERRQVLGLEWIGNAWTVIGQPTLWRKDGTYTVIVDGVADEFNNRSSSYSQKKPITGAKFGCLIFVPGEFASECRYTARNGDVYHFLGQSTPFAQVAPNWGQSAYGFGNLGMTFVRRFSVDSGDRTWGWNLLGYGIGDTVYSAKVVKLSFGGQSLTITTPNHDGSDVDEHYLRPKSTTQTVTDDNGSVWSYKVNADRRLVGVFFPGGASNVTYEYDSNSKVRAVNNLNGKWAYNYSDSGNNRTVTVTNPLGGVRVVKSRKDKNWVVEDIDEKGISTKYYYNTDERLSSIVYPAGNREEYTYDTRGNVTQTLIVGRPGSGLSVTRQAGYPATCTDPVTCNRPTFVIEPNGITATGRTDFSYQASSPHAGAVAPWVRTTWPAVMAGTGRPTRVQSPSITAGDSRVTTENVYTAGALVESWTCKSGQICDRNAPDTVLRQYDYGPNPDARRVFRETVTSGALSVTTCHEYDNEGRRISSTPPRAGALSCPYTVFTALPANATVPVAPGRILPVFPDGTTPPAPPPPPDPDQCGGTTGVVCQ
jgi:YD repeat-containing protein